LASSALHILLLFYDWSCHAHHHHLICVSFNESSEHRRRRHGLELAVVRVSSSPSSGSRACRGCRRLHEMVELERAQQRRI
ncbi:unnamed protein product, partial [Brassica oleracea]